MKFAVLVLSIGCLAGVLSGTFGIGGGIVIVPALIYLAGFTEHQAVGTSLAALLPPVALFGVIEHWRNGNVRFVPAMVLAVGLLIGAKLGAQLASRMTANELRGIFGVFVTTVGLSLIASAIRRGG